MMKQLLTLSLSLIAIYLTCLKADDEDFYKLLGIPRDADNRAIRKAFKELAVKLHPDKNTEDTDAVEKFIKLTLAYETLKDPDTRKHYDLHGDYKTSPKNKQPYQSYSYYKDVFGIYDDDPLILTLSLFDYESNINDPNLAWFVNFYSPHCHHCHELAPTWRKLASALEGVIRIAAVNCEEDWQLCHQLSIQAYPTLLFYSKESHMFEGERYRNPKTLEELEEFVMQRLKIDLKTVSKQDWEQDELRRQQWVLFLCGEHEQDTMLKVAAILDGLASVGVVNEPELCKEFMPESSVVFRQVNASNQDADSSAIVHSLDAGDSHELTQQVLALLPDPQPMNQDQFAVRVDNVSRSYSPHLLTLLIISVFLILLNLFVWGLMDIKSLLDARTRLRLGDQQPWLICFLMGAATELSLQLKRLPALLPNLNIGTVECARNAALCASLHVSHYPSWGVLKEGGAFEMHHGKDTLYDIVAFARDSSVATNLHALSPADVINLLSDGSAWFIDWYAPWCPPCQRLMPEIRRASRHFTSDKIKFGTVDCTLHGHFCAKHSVYSYPTTALYNDSKIQHFHGKMQEANIVEFIHDMLNPSVISLNSKSFHKLVGGKPANEMWLVEFFTSWCGPCQKFAGQWRSLAKQVAHMEQVHIAQVDCVAEEQLCSSQNIRSYPTIRLYPVGSEGLNTVAMYNGHQDAMSVKRWLLGFLPSPVLELDTAEFRAEVLTHKYEMPWLIDFYAPWCGYCVQFEPEFLVVAQRLEGQVNSGKVNCESHRQLCKDVQVSNYPTVMLYLTPTLRYEIADQHSQQIIDKVKNIISRHKILQHDEF